MDPDAIAENVRIVLVHACSLTLQKLLRVLRACVSGQLLMAPAADTRAYALRPDAAFQRVGAGCRSCARVQAHLTSKKVRVPICRT